MKTTAIFARTLTTSTVSAFDLVRDECSKGLEFVSNEDGTCTVSGIGTCTDTDIKIPSVYNGEKVTGIGDEAFFECSNIGGYDNWLKLLDHYYCGEFEEMIENIKSIKGMGGATRKICLRLINTIANTKEDN